VISWIRNFEIDVLGIDEIYKSVKQKLNPWVEIHDFGVNHKAILANLG